MCVVLLAIDAATAVVVVADVTGPVRLLLALAFASFVPGGALVAHWPPRDPVATGAAVVALSWAVTVLLDDVLIELGCWSPETLLVAMAAAGACSLGVALRRHRP